METVAVYLKKEINQTLQCNSTNFVLINDRKSYAPLTKKVGEHVLFVGHLTSLEKLYYLLSDLYSNVNESINGLRETEKSGRQWANLLGCSEEWVFQMQKNLEKLGYFKIIREKDEDDQNEKNIIIPTLPDDVFKELSKEPNRIGKEYLVFVKNNHEGCKRSYLDNSKMFVKFNLQMIKLLLIDGSITSLQKLIWLHFFCRSYIAYTDSDGEGTRNFITNYKELAGLFACNEKTVSAAMINLAGHGYIAKKQFYIKDQSKLGRRKKRSCWEISALFPQHKMELVLQQPDREGISPLTKEDLRLYGIEQSNTRGCSNVSNNYNSFVRSGDFSETSQYYNKYNISNINKNIDQAVTEITNNSEQPTNVPIEKDLTATREEITVGLQIAEKFDEKAFELAKEIPYPEAVKKVDLTLTNTEHWVVTKTAYTLSKKHEFLTNTHGVLEVETNFTQPEQRLIALWNGFAEPITTEQNEEFLLRRSWLVKLLNPSAVKGISEVSNSIQENTEDLIEQQRLSNVAVLPGDKKDKAFKFAYAVRERGLAKGYAAEIDVKDLAYEFIHHAATWVPERLNCKTRVEQIDAALSFAWRAAEEGRWRCPYTLLNTQIQQRELEAAQWKTW